MRTDGTARTAEGEPEIIEKARWNDRGFPYYRLITDLCIMGSVEVNTMYILILNGPILIRRCPGMRLGVFIKWCHSGNPANRVILTERSRATESRPFVSAIFLHVRRVFRTTGVAGFDSIRSNRKADA